MSPQADKLIKYLYHWEKTGEGSRKVDGIARDLELTELEVLRALRELADLGLVEPARN